MDCHNLEDDQITDQPPIAEDEASSLEEPRRHRPGLVLILVTLLVVLAMLVTLIGPMLRAGPRRQPTPTPTPVHFQTA
jgi:hypothetical protein